MPDVSKFKGQRTCGSVAHARRVCPRGRQGLIETHNAGRLRVLAG